MAAYGVSHTLTYTAWDTSANVGKTGDVANHTLSIVRDGTAATPTNSPAELAGGEYKIVLTAAEMQALTITLRGTSSTANVVIVPVRIATIRLPNVDAGSTGGLPVLASGRGLPAVDGSGYTTAATVNDKTGYALAVTPPTASANATATRAELATELGRIDAAVTSRYSGTQATEDVTNVLAAVQAVPGLVWAAGSRTLTGFGTLVADLWSYATRTLTGVGTSGIATEATADAARVAAVAAEAAAEAADASADGVQSTLDGLLEDDGAGGERLTAEALANAPTGSGATQQQVSDLIDAAFTAADPLSRAEGTADKTEILTAIGNVEIDTEGLEINALTEDQAANIDLIPGIHAKTALIGTAEGRRENSPLNLTGEIVRIDAGDDYTAAAGTSIDWPRPTATHGDLTGHTVQFSAGETGSIVIGPLAGSIVNAGTANQLIRVQLTAVQTNVAASSYPFAVLVTSPSGRRTRIRGTAVVSPNLHPIGD